MALPLYGLNNYSLFIVILGILVALVFSASLGVFITVVGMLLVVKGLIKEVLQ